MSSSFTKHKRVTINKSPSSLTYFGAFCLRIFNNGLRVDSIQCRSKERIWNSFYILFEFVLYFIRDYKFKSPKIHFIWVNSFVLLLLFLVRFLCIFLNFSLFSTLIFSIESMSMLTFPLLSIYKISDNLLVPYAINEKAWIGISMLTKIIYIFHWYYYYYHYYLSI